MNQKAPYKKLLTYKYALLIHYLVKIFIKRYLPGRENLRNREQWDQACRSGARCIAEGAAQGTSLKGYIKMLGVSRGSFEELLEDVIVYAREKKIPIWDRRDMRFRRYRIFIKENQPIPPYPPIPQNQEVFVNILIDLLQRENYLLDQQKRSLEEKHMKEGGFTEKLYKRRNDYRNKFRIK